MDTVNGSCPNQLLIISRISTKVPMYKRRVFTATLSINNPKQGLRQSIKNKTTGPKWLFMWSPRSLRLSLTMVLTIQKWEYHSIGNHAVSTSEGNSPDRPLPSTEGRQPSNNQPEFLLTTTSFCLYKSFILYSSWEFLSMCQIDCLI